MRHCQDVSMRARKQSFIVFYCLLSSLHFLAAGTRSNVDVAGIEVLLQLLHSAPNYTPALKLLGTVAKLQSDTTLDVSGISS